ncbi:MAG: zinc ribbon domain-containing protein [Candidatus Eremiobacterota bacterium]
MTDRRRIRGRKSARRVLRLAVALLGLVLIVALGLILSQAGRPRGAVGMGYNQFEASAKAGDFEYAWVDGNVFYLRLHGDRNTLYYVDMPDPSGAVALLTKKGTLVSAYRPVPSSGLSPAVLLALVIPYGFMGAMLLGMLQAASQAPVLGAPEDEDLELPAEECPGCGKVVANPDEFCPHCAHRLQWSGKQLRCGACSEPVFPRDRFCRSCGASAAEARSISASSGDAIPESAEDVPATR